MEDKEEEKKFSLFRRRSTKNDHNHSGSKNNTGSGSVLVGARLSSANEKSATLPSQSSAQAASNSSMTQSPSGGLFSKLKRRFRLRSSKGKYDFNFKDYEKPQRLRRKSDDPLRVNEQSDPETTNLARVTSSVKTPRRAQSDKENVILIRKDKCVSVICQDESGASEVIFSNMYSTEDNSDSISESWGEGGDEDPYATINSVKEEIQEKFSPNGRETADVLNKQERDKARAKELLQYSVDSASSNSSTVVSNGVGKGKTPTKLECVNVEDLYAKIESKNKPKISPVGEALVKETLELQKEQKGEELNRRVAAQVRSRQEHEYETLEDVRVRASELFNVDVHTATPVDAADEGEDRNVSCMDVSGGCDGFKIEPDYETLEEVRDRVSVTLSSLPETNHDGSSLYQEIGNDLSTTSTPSSTSKTSTTIPNTPSSSTTSPTSLPITITDTSSSSPSNTAAMAPLALSIDSELPAENSTKNPSSSSPTTDCIYDNPNVILRKQFFRHSLGSTLSPHHRQNLTLAVEPSLSSSSSATKKSTQAEEELIEKLSSQLAPPLPLRMYQKEEVGVGKGNGGGGGGSRHSWSSHSGTTKFWDMSGSWHAGMEGSQRVSSCRVEELRGLEEETENKSKSGENKKNVLHVVKRSKSQEFVEDSKQENNFIIGCGTKNGDNILERVVDNELEEGNEKNNPSAINALPDNVHTHLLGCESLNDLPIDRRETCEESHYAKISNSVSENSMSPQELLSSPGNLFSSSELLSLFSKTSIGMQSAETNTANDTAETRVCSSINVESCNNNSNTNNVALETPCQISVDNSLNHKNSCIVNKRDFCKDFCPDKRADKDNLIQVNQIDCEHSENQSQPLCDYPVSHVDIVSSNQSSETVPGLNHKDNENDIIGAVCLRKKGENAGTNEWKKKRKSGPNASSAQDMVEMSAAFEHGEFQSGFTEQYKAEEDEEGFGGEDKLSNSLKGKDKLLPMSEIVSFPKSKLLVNGLSCNVMAPICRCEDLEDCVCYDGCDDVNARLTTTTANNDAISSQFTDCGNVTVLNPLHIAEKKNSDVDNNIKLHCQPSKATSLGANNSQSNEDNNGRCVTGVRKDCTAGPKIIVLKKNKKRTDTSMSAGCGFGPDPNSIDKSSAMNDQAPISLPWENLICPTTVNKCVKSSLSSSSQSELAAQLKPQHNENQKLFLQMLRLLENVINGFCQQWMAIDLTYLLTGVFKWSRCFHLNAEEFTFMDQKVKRLFFDERVVLLSNWNVVVNKFYEKVREKYQHEMDSVYQIITPILRNCDSLPTFQDVRLNILGSFLLQYELNPSQSLSALIEQHALRISEEDLTLWMQMLSSDNWVDSRRMEVVERCSNKTLLEEISSWRNSISSSQHMHLNLESCQMSLSKEVTDSFSNLASSSISPELSPSDPEAKSNKDKKNLSSPSRRSDILNEFFSLCDGADDSSDEEDENDTIRTYIKTVTISPDTEHNDINTVYDVAAILSLCRVFHGELAYTSRIRKPCDSLCKAKNTELSECFGKQSHLSNSIWQEVDYLMRKLIPPISPRLDFQFLLRTYAEFKFFVLKERQRRNNSRSFVKNCFQIQTKDGPRCCRKEEMVFLKLLRDELRHFESVIRRSSASESLFVEDREVSYSLTKLLRITMRTLSRMKSPGKRSTSRSRSCSSSNNDNGADNPTVLLPTEEEEEEEQNMSFEDVGVRGDVGVSVACDEDGSALAPPPKESSADGVGGDDNNDDGAGNGMEEGLQVQERFCITPREKAEFHIENYRSFRAGCMWSDLDQWQSPDAFRDDPNILDRNMRNSFCVDRDTNATLLSHSTWGHYEEPKPLQERDDFLESMQQLQLKDWYWGPLSYEQAAAVLKNYDDGSFLVRDSSDRKYLLSLSFKSLGEVYHTRIEHAKGLFSFWSQPDSHGKARICEFIEKSVQNSHDGKFLYFLSPMNLGNPPLPIRLLNPVSRNFRIPSLRHLSRFVIRQHVRRDHIEFLPVPRMVKGYLRQKQFYVDFRDKERWSFDGTANTVL